MEGSAALRMVLATAVIAVMAACSSSPDPASDPGSDPASGPASDARGSTSSPTLPAESAEPAAIETATSGPPPPGDLVESDPREVQAWIDGLRIGAPPRMPYWHDGVLHVRGVEIETPWQVGEIDARGGTVLVGRGQGDGIVEEWALVEGDRFVPVPMPDAAFGALSADGRIMYWTKEMPRRHTWRFGVWDTQTHRTLVIRDVRSAARIFLVGVGSDRIAYWIEWRGETEASVMRWDVRDDTVEPSDFPFDPQEPLWDQFRAWGDAASWMWESGYVSPDGTRRLFTDAVSGDEPQDCCWSQLRVRPVGPIGAVDQGEVTTLPLPRGIPHQRLWTADTDRGIWWVWWESNQSVLLDAVVRKHSYLVRCSTTGGGCELVFDLGPNPRHLYTPRWEEKWVIARFPLTR